MEQEYNALAYETHQTEAVIEAIKAKVAAAVAEAVHDGKPSFTNETSRKGETLRRLAELDEYTQATRKLDDVAQRRTAKGSELTYLSNQFSATKSLARLYAAWMSRDAS